MKLEGHLNAYKEHRDAVNWAINRELKKSQRIIGIHDSLGIIELLSAYLHKIEAIGLGFQINHRWFKTEKVKERFPDFPKKELLLKKIINLELKAENLIYGSEKSEQEIKETLTLFNELEKILLNLIEEKK